MPFIQIGSETFNLFHSLLYFVIASLPAAESALKEQSTTLGTHFTERSDLKQPCVKAADVTRVTSMHKTQNKL